MKIEPETLEKLIENFRLRQATPTDMAARDMPQRLADYLAERLAAATEIRAAVEKWRREADALRARHQEETAAHAQVLRALQGRCPHLQTRYHPDPASGQQSWAECEVSGAEVPR
jgi:hypothetical protein